MGLVDAAVTKIKKSIWMHVLNMNLDPSNALLLIAV